MKACYLLAIFACILVSCSSDENESGGCIAETLERENMVPYAGQDLACRTYLRLYTLNDKKYFSLDNECTDIIFNPFDCDGNFICESFSAECADVTNEGEMVRIVGIAKP